MIVDGLNLDLTGLEVQPGHINAHDHLQFALFPLLGSGPYRNATEWAHDIHRPDEDPVRQHLKIPKELRLLWGGLRNLLAGVTTVSHHDSWHPVFDQDFPVRVVKNFGWAHSPHFTENITECFKQTPPGAPFLIHLGEGTDEQSANEIFQLDELGALQENTVLIHAVGLTDEGWDLVRERGASVIWCPRSNLHTLGRTAHIPSEIPFALGTDSPITATGDLLDEIRSVHKDCQSLVGSNAQRILRLPDHPDDWIAVPRFGEPPELVVIDGKIRLISPPLAQNIQLPNFSPLEIEGRPKVFVATDIEGLIEKTAAAFGSTELFLAGRKIRY